VDCTGRPVVVTGGWQTSKESAYVQASRAREATEWFLARDALGSDGQDERRVYQLAGKMRTSRAHTPSLEHRELANPHAYQLSYVGLTLASYRRRAGGGGWLSTPGMTWASVCVGRVSSAMGAGRPELWRPEHPLECTVVPDRDELIKRLAAALAVSDARRSGDPQTRIRLDHYLAVRRWPWERCALASVYPAAQADRCPGP
jgi:hypothetical protein